MYPSNDFNFALFQSLIDKAYWPIYGEMKILDELSASQNCDNNDSSECPSKSGTVYSYLALLVYMVIAHVLLINLLIAMFGSTFESVHDKTDMLWKFQRYRLVFEYFRALPCPPPISFLGLIISVVKCLKEKKYPLKQPSNVNTSVNELFLEKKFAEEYIRNKRITERDSNDSRLKFSMEKIEFMEQKLNEVVSELQSLKFKNNQMVSDEVDFYE
jgi:hypothetical protein